jgi:hypothetical protein
MQLDVWQIEKGFWTGDAAFYGKYLAPNALMVFPMGVLDRAATIETIREAPRWRNVQFEDQRLSIELGQPAMVVYRVIADRGDASTRYEALCSSVYVESGSIWKLLVHQQTIVNSQVSGEQRTADGETLRK